MKGGVTTPVTLTAYVLISLLEADLPSSDVRAVKASKCVENSLDDVDDSYSLAIIAYMFAKAKNDAYYAKVMKKLDDMAIEEGLLFYKVLTSLLAYFELFKQFL